MQSAKILFDANIPQFNITVSDSGPEIYKSIFGYIDDLNSELVTDIYNEFDIEQYLPYEKVNTSSFFKRLVRALSPKGEFLDYDKGIESDQYPKIFRKPVLFLRKRNLGFGVAIETIIEDLNTNESIPNFINDIVGNVTACKENQSNEIESNSILGSNGVDKEILLTKPANLEQLSVAKHLQRNDAVLVQGPPGTGKTHTISNIIGHLLSEGKSILVTSYSEKALKVLKEKVDPNLQSLCLSLLSGNDNKREMEITLDDINEKRANIESRTLMNRINTLENEREGYIEKLKSLEQSLKNTRKNEYRPIVISGIEYSPIEAAKYIKENRELLIRLEKPIELGATIPLNQSEITELFRTNVTVSKEIEKEYSEKLPDINELITPFDFELLVTKKNTFVKEKLDYNENIWNREKCIVNQEKLKNIMLELKETVSFIDSKEQWKLESIIASKTEQLKQLWVSLISEIEDVYNERMNCYEFIIRFNPEIEEDVYNQNMEDVFTDIINKLSCGGKLGTLSLMFNKRMKLLINGCKVNGKEAATLEDYTGLKKYYQYNIKRKNLQRLWDRQVASLGAKDSNSLGNNFEETLKKYSEVLKENIKWYSDKWEPLLVRLEEEGMCTNYFDKEQDLSSDKYSELISIKDTKSELIIKSIESEIYRQEYKKILEDKLKLQSVTDNLVSISNSKITQSLIKAISKEDIQLYKNRYQALNEIRELEPVILRRRELLSKLSTRAIGVAKLIEERIGVFGKVNPPDNFNESWLYTQLIEVLEERNRVSIDKIQKEIKNLQDRIRQNTSELAFNKAWLSMINKLSNNKTKIQAIEGWRQLIRKIGAGKGKMADTYKAEARKLMPECQGAIPVWIMPLNKVVENFNPSENKFDVVIIDEASQADVMALVALYLGKQVIIVGDNEQVSPLAIGEKVEEVERLVKGYLEGIPNKTLYSGKFSIYDLAQASGYQPIRLKEHFRCVPEIIQFSNLLSYNNKIRALRETSDVKTKPPIVTYRVENATCNNKVNEKEAQSIVSLILSCCKKPEYDGKTFGVITLRGDKQAKVIEKLLMSKMDIKEFNDRNILCGNSANFQGDERDIIFLSMVDVNENDGPMRLTSYGADDKYKKRYNVAVSRARDQLWLIHSIDSENDLKMGDLRKELLDYCKNYKSRQMEFENKKHEAESEFELRVMKALIEKGYKIKPQWQVGAFRIDMVAVYKNKKVAIECDGERWHGEDKLGEDIARQSILERLGWKFIRIRGSEFFKDEVREIKKVIRNLDDLEIYPEEGVVNLKEDNGLVIDIISESEQIRDEVFENI